MYYYTIMVFLLVVTALLMRGNLEKNLRYVIVGCLILFSVYGLRDAFSVGDDSSNTYYGGFLATGQLTWNELWILDIKNKGYYMMNKIMYTLTGGDYQAYITILSAVVTFSLGYLVYRYSPSPVQSFLYFIGLLLFSFHFSALKQSAAMALIMLAFDQIYRKRPIVFVLLVVLAGTFHFPALVFLPAYWISKIHFGKYYLLFFVILMAVVFFFRNQIINFMMELYETEESNIDLTGVRFLRNKVIIMIAIIVAAVVFRSPTKEDSIYEALLSFIGIAIVFQTFSGYNNIFERLADYYFQFAVIFIPMVFDKNVERRSLFNWRLMSVVDSASPYLFCGFGIYRFLTYVRYAPTLRAFRFFFMK